jgi:hypothetical protein
VFGKIRMVYPNIPTYIASHCAKNPHNYTEDRVYMIGHKIPTDMSSLKMRKEKRETNLKQCEFVEISQCKKKRFEISNRNWYINFWH